MSSAHHLCAVSCIVMLFVFTKIHSASIMTNHTNYSNKLIALASFVDIV